MPPLKIHLFLASHRMFTLTKLYHAEETRTRGREARKEFFFAATFIARIFVVAGKLAEIYCLDLGGERDEEHDKELTERLECQESLLRTFFQGKEGCGDARQASTIEGNNSFWISHTIYHGSRPIVPTDVEESSCTFGFRT